MIPDLPSITLSPWTWGVINGLTLGLLIGFLRAYFCSIRALVSSERALVLAYMLDESVEAAKDEGYFERIEPRLDDARDDAFEHLHDSKRKQSLLEAFVRRRVR